MSFCDFRINWLFFMNFGVNNKFVHGFPRIRTDFYFTEYLMACRGDEVKKAHMCLFGCLVLGH